MVRRDGLFQEPIEDDDFEREVKARVGKLQKEDRDKRRKVALERRVVKDFQKGKGIPRRLRESSTRVRGRLVKAREKLRKLPKGKGQRIVKGFGRSVDRIGSVVRQEQQFQEPRRRPMLQPRKKQFLQQRQQPQERPRRRERINFFAHRSNQDVFEDDNEGLTFFDSNKGRRISDRGTAGLFGLD